MSQKKLWRPGLITLGFILALVLAAAGAMQFAPMTHIAGANPVTVTRGDALVARFGFNEAAVSNVWQGENADGSPNANITATVGSGTHSVDALSPEGDGAFRGGAGNSSLAIGGLGDVDFSQGVTISFWVNQLTAISDRWSPMVLLQAPSAAIPTLNLATNLYVNLFDTNLGTNPHRGNFWPTPVGYPQFLAQTGWQHAAIRVGASGGAIVSFNGVHQTHNNSPNAAYASVNLGNVLRDIIAQDDFGIAISSNLAGTGSNNNRMFDDLRIYNAALTPAQIGEIIAERPAADLTEIIVNAGQPTATTINASGINNRSFIAPMPTGSVITAMTATATHSGATVHPAVIASDGQSATITVDNGVFSKTYTVDVVPLDPHDAIVSISHYNAAGDALVPIPGVSFLESNYTVALSPLFTAPPRLSAEFSDNAAVTVTISDASAFTFAPNGNGTAVSTINVTSVEGTREFEVTFTRAAAAATTLTSVAADGDGIGWFNHSSTPYFVNRSATATATPVLSYTTAWAAVQDITVTQATGFGAGENQATIRVEDTVSGQYRTFIFVMQRFTNERILTDFRLNAHNGDGQFYDSLDSTRVATLSLGTGEGSAAGTVGLDTEHGAANFNRSAGLAIPGEVLAPANWTNEHELTISLWMNSTAAFADWHGLFGIRRSAGPLSELMVGPGLFYGVNHGAGGLGSGQAGGVTPTTNGVWNNIVVSINRQQASFFVNGVHQSTHTSNTATAVGGSFNWSHYLTNLRAATAAQRQIFLGRNFVGGEWGTHWYSGLMRDFRLYDMALTEDLINEYIQGRQLAMLENLSVTGAGAVVQNFASNIHDYTVFFDVDNINALPAINYTFSSAAQEANAAAVITWRDINGAPASAPLYSALHNMTAVVTTTANMSDSFEYRLHFRAASANLTISGLYLNHRSGTDGYQLIANFNPNAAYFFVPWEGGNPGHGTTGVGIRFETQSSHVVVTNPEPHGMASHFSVFRIASNLVGVAPRDITVIFAPEAIISNNNLGTLTINGNVVQMTGNSLTFDVGAATSAPTVAATAELTGVTVIGRVLPFPGADVNISSINAAAGAVTITITAPNGSTQDFVINFVSTEEPPVVPPVEGNGCGGCGSAGITTGLLVILASLGLLFLVKKRNG